MGRKRVTREQMGADEGFGSALVGFGLLAACALIAGWAMFVLFGP
jgi:hypothetical protein